jgi:uncharacterized damage-inducible protein DinB
MHCRQVKDLAAYNQWMNSRLYAVCAEIPDARRREDKGAFFKSIHGTLNHLLLADKIWLGRFQGEPFPVTGLDQELHHDFDELKRARQATDDRIVQWAETLTDDILAGRLCYTSVVDPKPRKYEFWLAVTHFFNHQTHHRGQLTTLLSQCGKDFGVTDLIWLPQVTERQKI